MFIYYQVQSIILNPKWLLLISNKIRLLLNSSFSDPSHTLNVDITSPTFTDVNVRYAVRRDGASASVSTPAAGYLGLQLQGTSPSQMNARLYSRYAVRDICFVTNLSFGFCCLVVLTVIL